MKQMKMKLYFVALVLVLILASMANGQPCLEEEDNCKGIEYMCCGWACVQADDMRLWWVCDYDDSNAQRMRRKLMIKRLKRAYLLP